MLNIDISPLGDCCTDHALEYMHKAMADPPDSPIWLPHWDPFISGMIEQFTKVGERHLLAFYNALVAAVRATEDAHKAFRPSRADVDSKVAQLSMRSPRDYSVEDWLVLVDWLLLQHLPDSMIQTEAEFLAVRAAIAGRLRAWVPGAQPGPNFETLVPVTFSALGRTIDLLPQQQQMLRLAAASAAENITNLGEAARHRIKLVILQHLQDKALGLKTATAGQLENRLFDEFSILNRDWRRIAITETGNITNEAVVAALPIGATVRRFEHYVGACEFCRKIHGMLFTVVDLNLPDKNGWTQVWEGKSNVGRSASPYKRVGGELVKRTPEEMWWPAAGLQHPNCRGGWEVVQSTAAPLRDAKTRDFVADLMRKHGLVVKAPDDPPDER